MYVCCSLKVYVEQYLGYYCDHAFCWGVLYSIASVEAGRRGRQAFRLDRDLESSRGGLDFQGRVVSIRGLCESGFCWTSWVKDMETPLPSPRRRISVPDVVYTCVVICCSWSQKKDGPGRCCTVVCLSFSRDWGRFCRLARDGFASMWDFERWQMNSILGRRRAVYSARREVWRIRITIRYMNRFGRTVA